MKPALVIRGWRVLTSRSPIGEALVAVVVEHRDGGPEHTLLVALNPRTASVCRCWWAGDGVARGALNVDQIPYHVADLAQTLCREHVGS